MNTRVLTYAHVVQIGLQVSKELWKSLLPSSSIETNSCITSQLWGESHYLLGIMASCDTATTASTTVVFFWRLLITTKIALRVRYLGFLGGLAIFHNWDMFSCSLSWNIILFFLLETISACKSASDYRRVETTSIPSDGLEVSVPHVLGLQRQDHNTHYGESKQNYVLCTEIDTWITMCV